MKRPLFNLIVWVVLVAFGLNVIIASPSYASTPIQPLPSAILNPSPRYAPVLLKGIKIYPDQPFDLDFIVSPGDEDLSSSDLKKESERLIKYFLAALTTPKKEMWVNLSPYEKDRVIPEKFGFTEMGRDMLAQDYLLKQMMASLTYPEEALGKSFWEKVYAKAYERYQTTQIPLNTFNKVWIVPDGAKVFEKDGKVYVVESRLKVMMEEDYRSLERNAAGRDHSIDPMTKEEGQSTNRLSSQVAKELLLPELEKEVNEGQHFAQLRQIYHSLILAVWYKQRLQERLLNQVYSNQNKIGGITINDPRDKQKIYEQYLAAFERGVYDYIKEDYDRYSQQQLPRRYFSGGLDWGHVKIGAANAGEMAGAIEAEQGSQVIKVRLHPRTYEEHEALIDQKILRPAFSKNDETAQAEKVGSNDPVIKKAVAFFGRLKGGRGLSDVLAQLAAGQLTAGAGKNVPQIDRITTKEETGIRGHASDRGIHLIKKEGSDQHDNFDEEAAVLVHELIAFMGLGHVEALVIEGLLRISLRYPHRSLKELMRNQEWARWVKGQLNSDGYPVPEQALSQIVNNSLEKIRRHLQEHLGTRQPDLLTKLSQAEHRQQYQRDYAALSRSSKNFYGLLNKFIDGRRRSMLRYQAKGAVNFFQEEVGAKEDEYLSLLQQDISGYKQEELYAFFIQLNEKFQTIKSSLRRYQEENNLNGTLAGEVISRYLEGFQALHDENRSWLILLMDLRWPGSQQDTEAYRINRIASEKIWQELKIESVTERIKNQKLILEKISAQFAKTRHDLKRLYHDTFYTEAIVDVLRAVETQSSAQLNSLLAELGLTYAEDWQDQVRAHIEFFVREYLEGLKTIDEEKIKFWLGNRDTIDLQDILFGIGKGLLSAKQRAQLIEIVGQQIDRIGDEIKGANQKIFIRRVVMASLACVLAIGGSLRLEQAWQARRTKEQPTSRSSEAKDKEPERKTSDNQAAEKDQEKLQKFVKVAKESERAPSHAKMVAKQKIADLQEQSTQLQGDIKQKEARMEESVVHFDEEKKEVLEEIYQLESSVPVNVNEEAPAKVEQWHKAEIFNGAGQDSNQGQGQTKSDSGERQIQKANPQELLQGLGLKQIQVDGASYKNTHPDWIANNHTKSLFLQTGSYSRMNRNGVLLPFEPDAVIWHADGGNTLEWVEQKSDGKTRLMVETPTNDVITAVETQNELSAPIKIVYDQNNRSWFMIFSEDPGMFRAYVRPALPGELRPPVALELVGDNGESITRDEQQTILKNIFPSPIWEVIQMAHEEGLNLEERRQVRHWIMQLRLLYASYNIHLQNKPFVDVIFKDFAHECDGFAGTFALVSMALDTEDGQMIKGFLGEGDVMSNRAHMQNLAGGAPVNPIARYKEGTSPLDAGSSKEAYRKEYENYILPRAQRIEKDLPEMADHVKLKIENLQVQNQIQKTQEELNEIESREGNGQQNFIEKQEAYMQNLEEVESRMDEFVLLNQDEQSIRGWIRWILHTDLPTEFTTEEDLMLNAHYFFGVLEWLKVSVVKLDRFAEDVDYGDRLFLEIENAKVTLFKGILAVAQANNWELLEPLSQPFIVGDHISDFITHPLKFYPPTVFEDAMTGELLEVGTKNKMIDYRPGVCLRKSENGEFRLLQNRKVTFADGGTTSGDYTVDLPAPYRYEDFSEMQLVNYPFKNDEWLAVGTLKNDLNNQVFIGPVADREGIHDLKKNILNSKMFEDMTIIDGMLAIRYIDNSGEMSYLGSWAKANGLLGKKFYWCSLISFMEDGMEVYFIRDVQGGDVIVKGRGAVARGIEGKKHFDRLREGKLACFIYDTGDGRYYGMAGSGLSAAELDEIRRRTPVGVSVKGGDVIFDSQYYYNLTIPTRIKGTNEVLFPVKDRQGWTYAPLAFLAPKAAQRYPEIFNQHFKSVYEEPVVFPPFFPVFEGRIVLRVVTIDDKNVWIGDQQLIREHLMDANDPEKQRVSYLSQFQEEKGGLWIARFPGLSHFDKSIVYFSGASANGNWYQDVEISDTGGEITQAGPFIDQHPELSHQKMPLLDRRLYFGLKSDGSVDESKFYLIAQLPSGNYQFWVMGDDPQINPSLAPGGPFHIIQEPEVLADGTVIVRSKADPNQWIALNSYQHAEPVDHFKERVAARYQIPYTQRIFFPFITLRPIAEKLKAEVNELKRNVQADPNLQLFAADVDKVSAEVNKFADQVEQGTRVEETKASSEKLRSFYQDLFRDQDMGAYFGPFVPMAETLRELETVIKNYTDEIWQPEFHRTDLKIAHLDQVLEYFKLKMKASRLSEKEFLLEQEGLFYPILVEFFDFTKILDSKVSDVKVDRHFSHAQVRDLIQRHRDFLGKVFSLYYWDGNDSVAPVGNRSAVTQLVKYLKHQGEDGLLLELAIETSHYSNKLKSSTDFDKRSYTSPLLETIKDAFTSEQWQQAVKAYEDELAQKYQLQTQRGFELRGEHGKKAEVNHELLAYLHTYHFPAALQRQVRAINDLLEPYLSADTDFYRDYQADVDDLNTCIKTFGLVLNFDEPVSVERPALVDYLYEKLGTSQQEAPFDIDIAKEARQGAVCKLWKLVRHNIEEFKGDINRPSSFIPDDQINEQLRVNQALNDIFGEDYETAGGVDDVQGLLTLLIDEIKHDWLVGGAGLIWLVGVLYAFGKYKSRDLQSRDKIFGMNAARTIEALLVKNSLFSGEGYGPEFSFKQFILEKLQGEGWPRLQLNQEEWEQLVDYRGQLDEQAGAIFDTIILMAVDAPQFAYDHAATHLVDALIPLAAAALSGVDHPDFKDRQAFNQELKELVLAIDRENLTVKEFYERFQKILDKYGIEDTSTPVDPIDRKNVIGFDEFMQKVRNKSLESEPVGSVEEPPFGQRHNGSVSLLISDQGKEFAEFQDYDPRSDDRRRIDARASARMGKPMVKRYEKEQEVSVGVILDLRQFDTPQDVDEVVAELVKSLKEVDKARRICRANPRLGNFRFQGTVVLKKGSKPELLEIGWNEKLSYFDLLDRVMQGLRPLYEAVAQDTARRLDVKPRRFYRNQDGMDENQAYLDRAKLLDEARARRASAAEADFVDIRSRFQPNAIMFAGGANDQHGELTRHFPKSKGYEWDGLMPKKVVAPRRVIEAATAESSMGNERQAGTDAFFLSNDLGGIDFDPTRLKLEIESTAPAIPFVPSPTIDQLRQIHFNGLSPEILQMTPANLPAFFGITLQEATPTNLLSKVKSPSEN